MDEPAYEWKPVVRSVGAGLEDLERCVSRTTSWLRDRGVDPQTLGLDDIGFHTVETPEGPGIEARIRLQVPQTDQLPVLIEGIALGRRFTFRYGENLLHTALYLAVERSDGSWRTRALGGGSLTATNERASGWSSFGDLEDGIWWVAIGMNASHVASARIFRGESKSAEDLPLYRPNSRFDVLCAATLIDGDGASIEYLDSLGEVIGRKSFQNRDR